jgi:hypothetical protein
MTAEFSIAPDRMRGLLHVTMGGFFTPDDVAAFRNELEIKLQLLRCSPNAHVMLCDVRCMKIQPQEIVSTFAQIVGNPRYRSRRLAFVTGSSLSRLQARRLTDRDGVSFFQHIELAEQWLFQTIPSEEMQRASGMAL